MRREHPPRTPREWWRCPGTLAGPRGSRWLEGAGVPLRSSARGWRGRASSPLALFPPQSRLGPVSAVRSEPIARGSRAVGSSRPHLKVRPVLLAGPPPRERTPRGFSGKSRLALVVALLKFKFPHSLSPIIGDSETKPTNQTKKAQQISDAGPRNSTSGVHYICLSLHRPLQGVPHRIQDHSQRTPAGLRSPREMKIRDTEQTEPGPWLEPSRGVGRGTGKVGTL